MFLYYFIWSVRHNKSAYRLVKIGSNETWTGVFWGLLFVPVVTGHLSVHVLVCPNLWCCHTWSKWQLTVESLNDTYCLCLSNHRLDQTRQYYCVGKHSPRSLTNKLTFQVSHFIGTAISEKAHVVSNHLISISKNAIWQLETEKLSHKAYQRN